MAEKSFPLENTVYTAEDASLWFATRTSGVHASDQLGVTAAGGLTVNVGAGVAWLKYADFAGVSYANTEAKTLQLATANANYPRIDRVVIRYSKSESRVYLAVKTGTAASSPSAPSVTRNSDTYEISLAQIRVNANASSISASNITDERMNNKVCGLMTDGVTPFETEEKEEFDGDADSLGGVDASVYQAFMTRSAKTVTVNSTFVNSGAITADVKGGVLKVGGYFETKKQHAGDGYTTNTICTIPGVKVSGSTYAVMIDHDHSGKTFNILLMPSGNNSVVQLEPSGYAIAANTWLNFGIMGIIA